MPEMKETPGGDRIEELLSQLKGIFGKLSEAEEQEAKQKIGPPPVSPASTPTPVPPATAQRNAPVFDSLEPAPPAGAPAAEAPPTEPAGRSVEFVPQHGTEDASPATPQMPGQAPPLDSSYVPSEVAAPEGALILATIVFYPEGRTSEARAIAQKVERITPKFTKVSFVLSVQGISAYNPKTDLKMAVLPHVQSGAIKAVLVVVEKSLDETRRKALAAEMEARGVYFQEVPVHQIEKKALYTDMLLGMVFFFDSQKPAPPSAA